MHFASFLNLRDTPPGVNDPSQGERVTTCGAGACIWSWWHKTYTAHHDWQQQLLMGMSAGKCNHLSLVAVIMIDDNWLFSGRYDVAADKLLLIFLSVKWNWTPLSSRRYLYGKGTERIDWKVIGFHVNHFLYDNECYIVGKEYSSYINGFVPTIYIGQYGLKLHIFNFLHFQW